MPDIRLPNGVNIRSKLGYAYLGNIDELEKLMRRKYKSCVKNYFQNRSQSHKNKINAIRRHINKIRDETMTTEGIKHYLNMDLRQQLQLCQLLASVIEQSSQMNFGHDVRNTIRDFNTFNQMHSYQISQNAAHDVYGVKKQLNAFTQSLMPITGALLRDQ